MTRVRRILRPNPVSATDAGSAAPILPGVSTRVIAPPLALLPNALTVARLAVIPAFIVLAVRSDEGQSLAAALVFGVAALTDQVDGWLARRWRVESEFGKFADPLADRLMIDAAVVILWLEGRLPWFALAIVLVRDGILIAGSKLALESGYEFSVSLLGKTATWLLYAALFGMMLTEAGTDWPLALFYAGLALAIAAGAGYVVSVWKAMT